MKVSDWVEMKKQEFICDDEIVNLCDRWVFFEHRDPRDEKEAWIDLNKALAQKS
jgi:hypothetical protein